MRRRVTIWARRGDDVTLDAEAHKGDDSFARFSPPTSILLVALGCGGSTQTAPDAGNASDASSDVAVPVESGIDASESGTDASEGGADTGAAADAGACLEAGAACSASDCCGVDLACVESVCSSNCAGYGHSCSASLPCCTAPPPDTEVCNKTTGLCQTI
jgi:hypothetical protein